MVCICVYLSKKVKVLRFFVKAKVKIFFSGGKLDWERYAFWALLVQGLADAILNVEARGGISGIT